MQQCLLALCGTEQSADATGHRFALAPLHCRIADRASQGHHELALLTTATFNQYPHHFRNHIAGATHHHHITQTHILAAQLVFVMQRGVSHGDTAHQHRLQPCHRGQGASATDLHIDTQHRGQRLFGRELVRQSETRGARDKTELLLLRKIINLVHHAIDVIVQRGTLGAQLAIGL